MTITQVSKRYELSPDTLRYYERLGLIPPVKRTPGGVRDYQKDDCRWIEFVKCMRSAGLPLEVLIRYFELFKQGEATLEARKQLLVEQRKLLSARMASMQETLERLNYKIESYEQTIAVKEKELKAF